MKTYSFDLLFLAAKKRELEAKFGPPISRVYLKHSVRGAYKGVDERVPLISHECLTVREFESEIERLHEELEEIRKAAQKKYAKYYGKAIARPGEKTKWKPKPKGRRPHIFVPPGNYHSIEPPRIARSHLERSWDLDDGKETVNGVSAKQSGIAGVVTPGAARRLREPVAQMAYYFRRESGYDFVQYSSAEEEDDGHRAYLWVDPDTVDGNERVAAIGACCFRWREWEDAQPGYALQWIWFHPHERRKGHLTKAWSYFQARLGNFIPEPPFSVAFDRFLLKQYDPEGYSKMEKENLARVQDIYSRHLASIRKAK